MLYLKADMLKFFLSQPSDVLKLSDLAFYYKTQVSFLFLGEPFKPPFLCKYK